MFKPIKFQPEMTIRVGSFKSPDERVLGIYRLRLHPDPENGPLLWELEEQGTFKVDASMIKVEPMPVPEGGIFYFEYKYGSQ